MNAYDRSSHYIQETWYNLRSGLSLQALSRHENGYIRSLDGERKGSIRPMDNLKLINSNHNLYAHVT